MFVFDKTTKLKRSLFSLKPFRVQAGFYKQAISRFVFLRSFTGSDV